MVVTGNQVSTPIGFSIGCGFRASPVFLGNYTTRPITDTIMGSTVPVNFTDFNALG
jgi:hypothetical protein